MTDLQATLRDRFGAAVSPPLLDLHGRPRRTHTPEAVQAVCEIADSVLATGDAEIQRLRSYVDRYRIGLVGMSRRATRFRIAWRNARQRAARYRARLAAAEARVTELEQALADADATQLHTDGACEAVQRAETAEAAIDGALPDLRRAIDSMPTTCRLPRRPARPRPVRPDGPLRSVLRHRSGAPPRP